MQTIFRADIYRILRSKAFYITFTILLAFNSLTIGVMNAFQSGADNWIDAGIGVGVDTAYDQDLFDAAMLEIRAARFDGAHAPAILATGVDYFYFLLPIIVFTAAAIFSNGTVKNDISWGISRTRLYLSKLLLCAALCAFMMLFYMGTGMIIATVLNGFGSPAPGHWVALLQVLAAQLFMLLSLTSFGVFLVFATRRTAAVVGAFIAFTLVPVLIFSILGMANPDLAWLTDFDLPTNMTRLASLHRLETREILRGLGLGAFYMLASTLGGIALFRRAEIK